MYAGTSDGATNTNNDDDDNGASDKYGAENCNGKETSMEILHGIQSTYARITIWKLLISMLLVTTLGQFLIECMTNGHAYS